MASKRKYNIKGTNDFLVLAGICFFMCLWAVKDAWYPSDKVLRKHPMEVAASFETDGSVETVLVIAGDSVSKDQVLAKLRRDRRNAEFKDAKSAYTEAKKEHAMLEVSVGNAVKNGASAQGISDMEQRCAMAEEHMAELLIKVNDLRVAMESSDLLSPATGTVIDVRASVHSLVESGETVVLIDPKDHFYAFNKSLAIGCFILFWVFLFFHILGR